MNEIKYPAGMFRVAMFMLAGLALGTAACGGNDITEPPEVPAPLPGVPSADPTLTISGLGNYNGKFVVAMYKGANITLICTKKIADLNSEDLPDAVEISGGRAVLSVYMEQNDQPMSYTGSGTYSPTILILSSKTLPSDTNTNNVVITGVAVNTIFSNGTGTCTAPLIADTVTKTTGKLTVNGISGYDNKYAVAALSFNGDTVIGSALDGKAVSVTGGSAIIPLYAYTDGSIGLFWGSGTATANIFILSSATIPENIISEALAKCTVTITFLNGVGTLNNPTLSP